MLGPHQAESYDPGMSATREEQAALVALLQTRPDKMSWLEITAKVLEAGSALAVWERHAPATLPGLVHDDALEAADQEITRWLAQGSTFLTVLDGDYPARLLGVHQAPPVLFARGELRPDDPAVSVVGSRKASPRGLNMAQSIAAALVQEVLSVVAGLAEGIDTAAHRAALDSGGRTVAFIGTGINRVYPASNRALHREIAERGLLLSQFWPDAPPQKHTFLMRNATMSGYGIATVVVEAGETSGARAQARMAVEHGRPVVLTDLVVQRNTWAQQLRGRPGVHVASTLGEVQAAVTAVREEQAALADDLCMAYA